MPINTEENREWKSYERSIRKRSPELKHTDSGGQGVADLHSKLHKQDFKINPVETLAQYTMVLAGKEEL